MNNVQELKNLKKLTVQLGDVNCTSCSSIIENSFTKLKAIKVSINFVNKKAYFEYDSSKWTVPKIIKILNNLGYKVIDWEDEKQNTNHHGHDMESHDLLNEQHDHESSEHQDHMMGQHSHMHMHKVKLRDLIEAIIGLILLVPLLLAMIHVGALSFCRNPYLQLVLATIIQFYIGRKFYIGTYKELIKQKWPGMYTLIAFGSFISYVFSIYLLAANSNNHLFFEVGSSIVVIVLIGDLISDYVQNKATNGLESLMNLNAKEVLFLPAANQEPKIKKVEAIEVNDILIVRKGESVPTDGILQDKEAMINEALITGEAKIIIKKQDDNLIGGTINTGENFIMKATRIGKDTVLSGIIKAVEEVQVQKPKLQKIADKIAAWFTPTIILIAILVFFVRYFAFNDSLLISIETAISTLVIACPCALGIATPLAVAVGINKAAKLGIIYNSASAFEKITKIDTICFDKTGTLTKEDLTITTVIDPSKYYNLALTLEKYSTHPIAQAFVNYVPPVVLKKQNMIVTDIKEVIGFGVTGKWENKNITLAGLNDLLAENKVLDKNISSKQINKLTGNIIGLAINNIIVAIFNLENVLQDNALKTISKIQRKGIEVILISGDSKKATELVAKKLNIKQYYAQVKPIEKAKIVKNLQGEGKKVAFVGDGINDVVALQQSDLAIAMGKGSSDIVKKNGDITIATTNINSIYQSIVLTKKTKQNIWANFIWAFGYNIVLIPLAAVGFIIPPLAAIAMAVSDLAVVGNSLAFRLIKYKFE